MENYPSLTERANFYQLGFAARLGCILPAASAMALEGALQMNEYDLVTRARLLGYYSRKFTTANRQSRAEGKLRHILWFIENASASTFAGDTYFSVDKKAYPHIYSQIKAAWQRRIESDLAHPQTVVNFAMFLRTGEPKECERLLQSIPQCPTNLWANRLLLHLENAAVTRLLPTIPTASQDFDFEAWQGFADGIPLNFLGFHGRSLPPLSVLTLEEVVERFPEDITARAELIGYYSDRWKRTNLLEVDPGCVFSLLKHVLWFVVHLPGGEFSGLKWRDLFDRRICSAEYELLHMAWTSNIKKHSQNAHVLANAAKFFSHYGQRARARQLAEDAGNLGKSAEVLNKMLTIDLPQKKPSIPLQARELEKVAVDEKSGISTSAPFLDYDLNEWSLEVDLNWAQLEGGYHWRPSISIENLDSVVAKESPDIYSRAKIIGYYCSWQCNQSLSDAQQASLFAHMSWFITNVPQSDLIGQFCIPLFLRYDVLRYEQLKSLLLRNKDSNDRQTFNAALALRGDNTEVRLLSKALEKRAPDWSKKIRLVLGKPVKETITRDVLHHHSFKPGRRKQTLSRAIKFQDFTEARGHGQTLPVRTVWSNERVLERNPNDLVLRAELMEALCARDQFHISRGGFAPNVSLTLVRQNLWWIENVPDAPIYFFTGSELNSLPEKYLGDHAIVLEAAKRQMSAYPRNLAIMLQLNHYFPLGCERAAIAALKNCRHLYPTNRKLQSRLNHLRSLTRR